MKSKDARRLFSGYLEDELSAEEEDAIRAHFAGSPDDLAEYRAFESTVAMVRSLPSEEAPESMTDEIMARVRELRSTGRSTAPLDATPWWRRFDLGARELLPLAATLVLGFVSAVAFVLATGIGSSGPDSVASREARPVDAFPSGGAASARTADSLRNVVGEGVWEQRLDRPLRQVGTGSEAPSIVF